MDPMLTIGFVGGAYGLTLAATTYSSRGFALPQRILSLLLAVIGAAILTIAFGHALPGSSDALETLELVLSLSAGPLLLAFVASSGDRDFVLRRVHALHLVPAVAALLTPMIAGGQLLPDRAIPLFQIPYTVAALHLTRRSRASQPVWSRLLVASFVIIHLAQMARTFGAPSLRNLIPAVATAAVLALGATGWRRLHQSAKPAAKYARSPLDADKGDDLVSRLESLLAGERLYTDPRLTLATVASRLGVSAQSVSQALSQRGATGFNQLVTRHRLEAACAELLSRPAAEVKIEAVALRAGFASRSSFYDAFKRAYGTTPTRYREAQLSGTFGSDNVG
jgi:AraC-like DNA-binding protein